MTISSRILKPANDPGWMRIRICPVGTPPVSVHTGRRSPSGIGYVDAVAFEVLRPIEGRHTAAPTRTPGAVKLYTSVAGFDERPPLGLHIAV